MGDICKRCFIEIIKRYEATEGRKYGFKNQVQEEIVKKTKIRFVVEVR